MGICERVVALCAELRWCPALLRGPCRCARCVEYRVIVARALYLEDGHSEVAIGAALGRHHRTIYHYLYKIELAGDERR